MQADILLVDDEPVNLRLLTMGLAAHDYHVRTAANGLLALDAAREQRPDIVLLDIMMPEMDGYETCEAFKLDEAFKDIPIIFISASYDVKQKVKALKTGGVDYITKPFVMDEVLARVSAHLRISQQQKEIQRLREQDQLHIQQLHREIERREAIEALEREQRILAETLGHVATIVNSALDPQEVMGHILANLERVIPHNDAAIVLRDGEAVQVIHPSSDGQPPVEIPFPHVSGDELFEVAQAHETGPLRTHAGMIRYLEQVGVLDDQTHQGSAAALAPIVVQGRTLGLLLVVDSTRENYTAVQEHRLRYFADHVAIALHNAQLYQQLNRYTTVLEEQIAQRTEQLQQAKDRVEVIVDNADNGLVLITRDGILQDVNNALVRAMGYPAYEMEGQSITRLFKSARDDCVTAALSRAIEAKQSVTINTQAQRQDGTTFDAQITLSPILDTYERVTRLVGSISDVTRQKRLENSLRKALEHERELNALKTRFIETVSHEFRTPLAVIQSSGEMLVNYYAKMSEQQRAEKIGNIAEGIERIVTLLDDSLALDDVSMEDV